VRYGSKQKKEEVLMCEALMLKDVCLFMVEKEAVMGLSSLKSELKKFKEEISSLFIQEYGIKRGRIRPEHLRLPLKERSKNYFLEFKLRIAFKESNINKTTH
jgi:hypothetical protein